MHTSIHQQIISRRQNAAALVVILAFIVLLTGLIVAFLGSMLSERQVSNSSANEGKTDLFAEGALETIIGDLKQEIVAGSTNSVVTTGSVVTTLYFPAAASMAPCRVGVSGTAFPNLIKRSAYQQPFFSGAAYTGAGCSRASSVASTTASYNSRVFSTARWNKPLLLPKQTTGQASDLTPAFGFAAPDWIYVDRSGSNPITVSSNIVGRYAYCIYDEGGVLDVNVAGFPSTLGTSQLSKKGGASFADLTQTGMTSAQVDALVAWRNYATLQPSGSFPNFTLTTQSGSTYLSHVLSNLSGFLVTSNTASFNNQTDQKFISRQQLIGFLTKGVATSSVEKAAMQDTLQYLGTFSRSLEQPSINPDSHRPLVVGYSAPPAPGKALFGADSGGNDAYGSDNEINPSFLKIRVTTDTDFTRADGSVATIGEPLVKQRFALNRLAWITYDGPSQLRNYRNPASIGADSDLWALENTYGISKAWLAQGTPENIKKYFGLTWDSANKLWTYDHGVLSGVITGIGRLSDVQGKGRDADFVELLKAATTVGSLAKGAATNHERSTNSFPDDVDVTQYKCDTSVNFHIIQLLCNIIDQFDCDGYPTHIQYAGNDFYGSENLAYLVRARCLGVNYIVGSGTNAGSGAMLLLPEIWNPYDASCVGPGPNPRNFRFILVGQSSVAAAGRTRVYKSGTQDSPSVSGYGQSVSLDTSANVASGVTELDFSMAPGSTGAAEPRFLGNLQGSSQATSIGLSVSSTNNVNNFGLSSSANGYITDGVSNLSYCGVLLGTFPTKWVISGTTYPLSGPNYDPLNPSSADMCQTNGNLMAHYILQYKDSSSEWRTYQDNYTVIPRIAGVSVAKASGVTSGNGYIDISGAKGKFDTQEYIGWMDPRTSRFGAFYNPSARTANPVTLGAGYYGVSPRPGTGFQEGYMLCTPGSGLQKNAQVSSDAPKIGWYPGNWDGNVTDGSRLFVPAYYAQNVTGNCPSPQGNANFFTDADGVLRRGMGAYVPASPNSTVGMPLAHPASLSQMTSRPYILNRPFRSVAELGCVFSGTPWRNIDFFTPESGFAGLLDLFCINPTSNGSPMSAGKVNLNTRQIPVVKALLSGTCASGNGSAYKDDKGAIAGLSDAEVDAIARALVQYTGTASGPLCNVSELTGKWSSAQRMTGATAPHNIDGSLSYTGFASNIVSIFNSSDATYTSSRVQRMNESVVRALSSGGQVRVWNLMIDLVAQAGRFPPNETAMDKFVVEGERRYWLHVAIDRFTGQVIDKQLELVKE